MTVPLCLVSVRSSRMRQRSSVPARTGHIPLGQLTLTASDNRCDHIDGAAGPLSGSGVTGPNGTFLSSRTVQSGALLSCRSLRAELHCRVCPECRLYWPEPASVRPTEPSTLTRRVRFQGIRPQACELPVGSLASFSAWIGSTMGTILLRVHSSFSASPGSSRRLTGRNGGNRTGCCSFMKGERGRKLLMACQYRYRITGHSISDT